LTGEISLSKPLCIYHGNCFDGFTAAWAVWKRYGDNFEYFPATYQAEPPRVDGKHVVIVDFSYKRDVLMNIAACAASVVVLDHHKTAAEDLAGFEVPTIASGSYDPHAQGWIYSDKRPRALFDMNRSGAGITWDFFHGAPRIPLINHVEDRDLWRFALPFTREIHAAMSSYPFEFSAWDEIAGKCERGELTAEGAAIDRKHLRDIDTLLAAGAYRMMIDGYDVPVCNLPVTMCSDAGNIMCVGEEFAATYYCTRDHRVFSLRSNNHSEDSVDVSEIAKKFGGGGHRNAAGFKLPHGVNP
jgi:hypothetical protein